MDPGPTEELKKLLSCSRTIGLRAGSCMSWRKPLCCEGYGVAASNRSLGACDGISSAGLNSKCARPQDRLQSTQVTKVIYSRRPNLTQASQILALVHSIHIRSAWLLFLVRRHPSPIPPLRHCAFRLLRTPARPHIHIPITNSPLRTLVELMEVLGIRVDRPGVTSVQAAPRGPPCPL